MPAHSSVYDRREFGWRDRLRRLVGLEDQTGRELLVKGDAPVLVTARGELIGFRCTDGTVLHLPDRPRRLEDLFDDEEGEELVWVDGTWPKRWIS